MPKSRKPFQKRSRRQFLRDGYRSALAAPLIKSSVIAGLVDLRSNKDQRFELLFDQLRLVNMRERYRFDIRWTSLFKKNRVIDISLDIEASKSFDTNDIPEYSEKLLASAFHTLLTKVNDHGAHSLAIMRGLSGLETWDRVTNPSNETIGLDYAAKSVIAQSFALDWIGLLMSGGARAEVAANIGSNGLSALERSLIESRDDASYPGWRFAGQDQSVDPIPREYIWESFLPIMSASALLIGSATFSKQFGINSKVETWIDLGIETLKERSSLFNSDGSFPGAASQAAIAGKYYSLACDVLLNLDVIDLRDQINWPGLSRYLSDLTYSTRRIKPYLVDFGDQEMTPNSGLPYWIARTSGDSFSNEFGTQKWGIHDHWGLINFNNRIRGGSHLQGTTLNKFENGTIVSKSSEEHSRIFAAMRTGPSCHGEHGDVNGLVAGAFGEMFICNPNRKLAADPDEALAMRRPSNRNVMFIDKEGPHFTDSFLGIGRSFSGSNIIRHYSSEDYSFWTSDATDAYSHGSVGIKAAVRTVIVSNFGKMILILDKVDSKEAHNVRANFVINNEDGETEIKVGDSGLLISRPKGKMLVSSFSANGALVDNTNEALAGDAFRKVVSRSSIPSGQQFLMTCLSFSKPDAIPAELNFQIGRSNSLVVERLDLDKRYKFYLFDTGLVPEIDQQIRNALDSDERSNTTDQ